MSEKNPAGRNREGSPVQQQVINAEEPATALADETSDEGYEAGEARTGDDPRARAPRDSAGRPSTGVAD
jgi:hypothetical protein